VFVTHAIPNHFGGAWSIIQLHKDSGRAPPHIYKHLAQNDYEEEVLGRSEGLSEFLRNTQESDVFFIPSIHSKQPLELSVIETPGHKSDHLSFGLKIPKSDWHQFGESILFPGDMILGSPSVSCDDMTQYMKDLKRVEEMGFDHAYLSHTMSLEEEAVVVDAKSKIRDYIEYREHKE